MTVVVQLLLEWTRAAERVVSVYTRATLLFERLQLLFKEMGQWRYIILYCLPYYLMIDDEIAVNKNVPKADNF